ncbi:UDP-4-amino-4,6-dideoxy-N-acetyl-beta-L-altrosamine transaminase [Candidatus Woesearchaeota archaeon]|nr:UDP-4-amino-4,6-dideoxy-N-acetyl-beta-L-altrosamine transaminase [Candidatus Woesearchaeota archaeon]
MKLIPYGKPSIGHEDILAVQEALRSGWLTTGPKVQEFEQAFARYVGSTYAIAVSSGTAALELALACLDIVAGEVITTPFTFVATANAILYNNLKPVFVDIDPETLNIDPKKIEKAITKDTKAIIYVDYAGQPCDIDAIRQIAKRNSLFLVEDAAHALGAKYGSTRVGAIADLTTFSFHPVKNMTTGEGGMITTNQEKLYRKLLLLRNHGLDKDDKKFGGTWSYDMKLLGRNYRLSDMQCALGLTQLQKIEQLNQKRAAVVHQYREAFSTVPEISVLTVQEKATPAWHLFVILLRGVERNALFEELGHRGIKANVHYIPIYHFDYYQKRGFCPKDFPITEKAFKNILTLPLYADISGEEVAQVIGAVKESIKKLTKN